jgi:hypothetical protein
MPDSPPFSVFVDTEREQLIGQMAYLLPCIEPHLLRAVGSCMKRAVCLIIVETRLVMSPTTVTANQDPPVADLDIQEWIQGRYGFVPHPFWISHCRELYLEGPTGQPRRPWHECPPEKRSAVKEAFRHFGMLAE